MVTKKHRIMFNIVITLYLFVSIGLLVLGLLWTVILYIQHKTILASILLFILSLIFVPLFYSIKELSWLLFYLIRKPPYSYLREKHLGNHESILVNYLLENKEEPNKHLLELASYKKV